MMFKYGSPDDKGEAVAFIDRFGNFAFRTVAGETVFLENGKTPGISKNPYYCPEVDPKHKFYPGDTLTIIF